MTPELSTLPTPTKEPMTITYPLNRLTPPIPQHSRTCHVCSDINAPGLNTCRNCHHCQQTFGVPPVPVEAITLYDRTSPIRQTLINYKNTSHPHQHEHVRSLRELIGTWHDANRTRLDTYGPLDGCVVVPSTTTTHNTLHQMLTNEPLALLGPPIQALAATGEPNTRRPSPTKFRATNDVAWKRFVLIDDVYTTGSTAQSAAMTLEQHHATVAFILVAARRINPVALINSGHAHPAYTTP